jgi:hypothetical protein
VALLVGCSSGSQKSPHDGSAFGGTSGRSTGGANGSGLGAGGDTGGGANGVGGAPSQTTDTNPTNPHVTNMPPASPNGPAITVQPGTGGITADGTGGSSGSGRGTGGITGTGSGGVSGSATGGKSGGATGGTSSGATGGTGAGNSGGSGNGTLPGSGGGPGGITDAGAPSSGSDAAVTGTNGGIPATWATVDCVGGPCGPPGVCVNLDFLFVACAHCGGVDEVCCPPYVTGNPWLGTCGAGLVCAHNPNFQELPPADLVQDVCQIPGSPPPTDGGLNHERLRITN